MKAVSSPHDESDVSRPVTAGNVVNAGELVPGGPAFPLPKRRHSKTERTLRRIGWNLLPPLTFVAMVA
jgi:hypothetical protein